MYGLSKLLTISSDGLTDTKPSPVAVILAQGRLGSQLLSMLELKNGFYAFESALHVFPACACPGVVSISQWNSDDLWKSEYEGLMTEYFCFAEDVFGFQFALREDRVYVVDPETAEPTLFAGDFGEWATRILDDFELHTGYTTAHQWQARHGPLEPGHRLIPKIPFVCGGDYQLDNLYSGASVPAMRFRGSLARQIKDLPDGSTIEFVIE